jgi:hypothetical protein
LIDDPFFDRGIATLLHILPSVRRNGLATLYETNVSDVWSAKNHLKSESYKTLCAPSINVPLKTSSEAAVGSMHVTDS